MTTFKLLTSAQQTVIKGRIATVKKSETTIKSIVNADLPKLVASVHAGGSVNLIQSLCNATQGTRRKALAEFVKAFGPNEVEITNGTVKVGKKYQSANKVKQKAKDFEEFLKSGLTVYQWIAREIQVEKKPVNVEALGKRFVKAAVENGWDVDQVLELIDTLVHEQADAA